MSKATGNLLALMDTYLADIRKEAKDKAASATKKATDPSDPTSHPVMKVDDGTQKATEGARSAENEADVKKGLGEAGITGQEDANSASSTHPSDSIGTEKQTSDETKGNVQQPKATKDKPPESAGHPSNSTFSEKYSSVIESGNKILAAIAQLNKSGAHTLPVGTASDTPASKDMKAKTVPPAKGEKKEEKKEEKSAEDSNLLEKRAAAEKHREDAEAGYACAKLLAEQVGLGKSAELVKQAIEEKAAQVVKAAQSDAVLCVDFLNGLNEGQTAGTAKRASAKRANEGMMIPPELLAAGAGGGGAPPVDPGMGGGMGGGMEGGLGGGGGGGDEEAVIDAIAEALAAEGVTPEELAQAIAEAEGGGGGMGGEGLGGGMGGGMGGGIEGAMPPAAPPAAPAPEEDTSSASREEKPKEEKDKSASAKARPIAVKKAALAGVLRMLVAAKA